MRKIVLATVTLASLAFGSATIISGSEQDINFNSEPEGVSVKLNGNLLCTTPCMKVIKKHTGKILTFEKEGYKTRQMIMSESVNVLTILGGLFGTTTDSSTGALWEYSPNNYYIELKEKSFRWDYNNKLLDKNLLSDIRSFILIEYQSLKLEYKLEYKINNSTVNLTLLLSKYFNINKEESFKFIKQSITKTDNPVQFIRAVKFKYNIKKGKKWKKLQRLRF